MTQHGFIHRTAVSSAIAIVISACSSQHAPPASPPGRRHRRNLTCDSTCPQECRADYTFVTFDPTSGTTESGATRRIFVGVWTDGVLVSEDGGETFSMIGADIHPVHSAMGPDGTLYVSFGIPEADTPGPGGVRAYRSTASGQWTDTDITPPSATNVSYGGISADLNHAGRWPPQRALQVLARHWAFAIRDRH